MSARGPLAALLVLAIGHGPLAAGERPPPKPAPEAKPAPQAPAESPEQQAARLAQLYEQAEALYKGGKLRDAQRLYAQIALEKPSFRRVPSRLNAIRGKLEEEERREARARVQRLLEEAEQQFAAGQYDAAARSCETVLATDPKNTRARQLLTECAGEVELQRRMFSIFDATAPAPSRQIIGQAKTAVSGVTPPPAPLRPEGGAPVVRSGRGEAAPGPGTARVVGPGANVETVGRPAVPPPGLPADPEGSRLLSRAWDLYQGAKLAGDPRPALRQAMDTLAPITAVSKHTQHTKDTAALLRKSIARRLAQGGGGVSAEEANQARLYQRYLEAEEHYRKQRYDKVVEITKAILAEDRSFAIAKRLYQQARFKLQEFEYEEMNLEQTLTVDRHFADIERQSVPPENPPPVRRPVISLERPTVELSSPELEEKLNQRVSVNLIEADLDYFLDLLFRSTGVNIIYNPEVVADMVITVHVSNYPLRQLLDYIARNHGLMFATTRDGVLITTPEEPRLETFVYPLHYGLIDVTVAPESSAVEGAGSASPPIEPPMTSNVEMLIEQLPQLIEWPQGSFTYLDRKMNLLYVRTTRDAYAEVLRLLEPIDQIPHQVLIKTLFVEVNLEDYETFGISANLMADDDERVQLSGALDFSPEQLPGLTTPTSGGTLSLAGVMTEPEFDLALDALQRTGTTRTLAAPNVICVNNCTARISVTQELIYVEDYEVDRADISGTTYGNPWNLINQQDPDAISNIGALSSEPIIIPVFAEGEDTGFTLDVAPSIGKDSRYITLMLNPRIRQEIPPRLSFELVFPTTRVATGEDAANVEQQTATVERPIIGERSLATKLTVVDGSIVVLGGLIQQKKIQVRSKIPVISDIPVIGEFFGRTTYRDEKTNLLIFVQAELITPSGARYTDSGHIDETRAAEDAARVVVEEAGAPIVRPGP